MASSVKLLLKVSVVIKCSGEEFPPKRNYIFFAFFHNFSILV